MTILNGGHNLPLSHLLFKHVSLSALKGLKTKLTLASENLQFSEKNVLLFLELLECHVHQMHLVLKLFKNIDYIAKSLKHIAVTFL